jgi:hypothetical protein
MKRKKSKQVTPPLPLADRQALIDASRIYLQTQQESGHLMLMAINRACEDLVIRFKNEQSELQQAAFREAQVAAASSFVNAKFPWCRMQLRFRMIKASKVGQLIWIDVIRHRTIQRRVVHKYMSGRGGIYDLKELASRAQAFDRELVIQTELQARLLRELMGCLKPCRRATLAAFELFNELRDAPDAELAPRAARVGTSESVLGTAESHVRAFEPKLGDPIGTLPSELASYERF